MQLPRRFRSAGIHAPKGAGMQALRIPSTPAKTAAREWESRLSDPLPFPLMSDARASLRVELVATLTARSPEK